jgi:hypothetical protein
MDPEEVNDGADDVFTVGLEQMYPLLFKNVGCPAILLANTERDSLFNARIKYEIPLSFCHSYNPTASDVEISASAVCQGGLLGGILDNAMTLAVIIVSNGRFQTTLNMATNFLRPARPGAVFAVAKVH